MRGLNYSSDNKTLVSCDFSQLPESIEIPFGVETIKDSVFCGSGVTSVIFPDSVTSIGDDQFTSCENLKFVHLPAHLTHLGKRMFADCPKLERVEMPVSVDGFPESLFAGCESLTEIPFRTGFSDLPENVFFGCTNVKSIIIPPSIHTIKNGAFKNCKNLTTLVLNNALEEIEDGALSGCTSLKYIRTQDNGQDFFVDEDSGCLYQRLKAGTLRLLKCPVIQEELLIPAEVVEIDNCAFDGCNNLYSITIQDDSSDNPIIAQIQTLLPEADISGFEEKTVSVQRKPITIEDLADIEPETDEDDFDEESDEIIDEEASVDDSLAVDEDSDYQNDAINEETATEQIPSQETQIFESDETDISTAVGISTEEEDSFNIFDDDDQTDIQPQTYTDADNTELPVEPQNDISKEDFDSIDNTKPEQEVLQNTVINDEPVSDNCNIEGLKAKEIELSQEDPDSRFINILKGIAKQSLMLEQTSATQSQLYGELENLIVIAEKSANITKEFSSHLIKYSQKLAEKYGFKKIYLFEKLPIEDDEFSHAFAGFSHDKNIVYACMAKNTDELSSDTKAFLEQNEIPSENTKIPSVISSQPKDSLLPLKLVVQDNYVEGLLFCAEKYLRDSGK